MRGPLGLEPDTAAVTVKDGAPAGSQAARMLDETWADPPGFIG